MNESERAVEQIAPTAENQAEFAQKLNEMVMQFKN